MEIKEKFFNKTRLTQKCWIWVGPLDKDGYGIFSHEKKLLKAHRISWNIHNGQIPDKLCVCHSCDNPSCVRPSHLFIGTQKDNVLDCVSKGRHRNPVYHGSDHPMYKKSRGL